MSSLLVSFKDPPAGRKRRLHCVELVAFASQRWTPGPHQHSEVSSSQSGGDGQSTHSQVRAAAASEAYNTATWWQMKPVSFGGDIGRSLPCEPFY